MTTSNAGTAYGLRMFLYVQQFDYLVTWSSFTAGFRVSYTLTSEKNKRSSASDDFTQSHSRLFAISKCSGMSLNSNHFIYTSA
jgi:hypothetical protein